MAKIEQFWRDATADDRAEIANTKKPIPARFRDEETESWREDLISGWRLSRFHSVAVWIDADGILWKDCQVYDEPSWYADKPDPGEGYRLLEKFPDEELKPGDELWYGDRHLWDVSSNACDGITQGEGCWYRRRIEPVEAVESKPLLICRRVVEIGDEIKLPNGQVLVFNGKGFEVVQ